MTTQNDFEWSSTKQLSFIQVLLAFAIPSALAFLGFRVVLPRIVENGTPVMIAWPSIAAIMLFGFVIAAFFLLRSEARQLNIPLATRMCLKNLSLKQWSTYGAILIIGFILSAGAAQIVEPFMKITGLTIPDYMPFFLNPAINSMEADPAILSPGLPLKGHFLLIPLMGITLILNILAEELYFRAWMLPKMSKYGNGGWIASGALFALYHTFQLWLFPVLLIASLTFSFVIYKSKSILPAMAGHFIANFLFTILGMLFLILG
ncbi:MAG: CPBP family intramembrane glutamic endopeptidase [Candidatus Hydrogenedentota bacterium]